MAISDFQLARPQILAPSGRSAEDWIPAFSASPICSVFLFQSDSLSVDIHTALRILPLTSSSRCPATVSLWSYCAVGKLPCRRTTSAEFPSSLHSALQIPYSEKLLKQHQYPSFEHHRSSNKATTTTFIQQQFSDWF